MAKKTSKKKTTRKASSSRRSAASRSGSAKKAAKKAAKKTVKKTAKKTVKKTAKKIVTTAAKKTVKKVAQKSGSKAQSKKTITKKTTTKKTTTKKPSARATAAALKKAAAAGNTRSVAAVAAAAQPDAKGYVLINGRRVRMISTKGMTATKKTTSAAKKTVEVDGPKAVPKIKTKLARKDLDEYGELLLRKRAKLLGLLHGIEDEALRSSGGNLSNMPLHMADVGTDTFDQDLALGMAETERKLLEEIDAALGRVKERTFGVCMMTGKQIPKARLQAKPWARYTIEAARKVESGLQF